MEQELRDHEQKVLALYLLKAIEIRQFCPFRPTARLTKNVSSFYRFGFYRRRCCSVLEFNLTLDINTQ